MRRLLAMLCGLVVLSSFVFAVDPTTAPATSAAPQPATRPATRPASRPATRPTTQIDPGQAAEDSALKAALDVIRNESDAAAEINALSNRLASSDITYVVDSASDGIYPLAEDVKLSLKENAGLLNANPSLELLRQRQTDLEQARSQVKVWDTELTQRGDTLTDGQARLQQLLDAWQARQTSLGERRDVLVSNARDVAKVDDTLARVDVIIATADKLKRVYDWEQTRAGNLLLSVRSTQSVVNDGLEAITKKQREARDRLLTQDSPLLWSALLHPTVQGDVAEQGRNSLANQWQALLSYLNRQTKPIALHIAGVFALAVVLIVLRRRTQQWAGNDPNLAAATRVFQTPIATAVTASMILTPWIYAGAPRLFWGILGTAALVPTIMVLRPLIEKSLRPLLYGLAAATFVSLLISIAAALPLLARSLQLVQMGGATVFFLWFLRTGRGDPADPAKPGLRKPAVVGAKIGLAITIIASLANVFGFVSLSRLIGSALLTSAYLGVLLDTSVHVADALLLGITHVRPLSALGMVQRHRPLLLKRLHGLLIVLAVCLWGYFTLESLTIRQPIFDAATAVWNWPRGTDFVTKTPDPSTTTDAQSAKQPTDEITGTFTANGPSIGNVTVNGTIRVPGFGKATTPTPDTLASSANNSASSLLTVGGVVMFVLSVAASIYTARFIAFLLDEDVYPRLNLARGMPYAISTLLKYTILAIGFSLAIVNLGYGDPTKLTILVSAFSIGLGFGLQNIVNNFVSGLILLFERPVQVGDVIEIEGVTGVVSRIGIRASVIRTPLAAEIILPNGTLISGRVVNWTLSNRQRGVELSVTVASAGVEPHKLIQLLTSTAKSIPLVAAYPAPQAYFSDFAGGGMKFDVRVWTNRFEDWALVRSELAVAINAMLTKENIPLK
ncbi:MAG: mechanosensitive ion channel [Tepidisphaeraceae bacterium]